MGEQLKNRYEYLRIIGRGGNGSVSLIRKKDDLGQLFVDKLVYTEDRKAMLKEAMLLRDLKHPGIPQVFEVIEDQEGLHIVQEYIEGDNLYHILRKERLSDSMIIDFYGQMVSVLTYVHKKQIIHRDIKPHNILLDQHGVLKLIDFGLSDSIENSLVDQATLAYAAPEQLIEGRVSVQSDIFSLGMTMCELMTGELPKLESDRMTFKSMPRSLSDEKHHPGLVKIIEKSIRIPMKQRYGHMQAIFKDLEKIASIKRWNRGLRWSIDLLIAVFVISGLGGYYLQATGEKQVVIEDNNTYVDIVNRGYSLIDQGNLEEAQALFLEAMAMDTRPEAYEGMLTAMVAQDAYGSIVSAYADQEIVQANLYQSELLNYYMGYAYDQIGDSENAYAFLKRANEMSQYSNPDHIRAFITCLVRSGQVTEANEVLSRLEALTTDDVKLAYSQGEVAYINGNYQKSNEIFTSIISELDDTMYKRAILYMVKNYQLLEDDLKNMPLAIALMKEYLNGDSGGPDIELIEQEALCYYRLGLVSQGEDQASCYREAVEGFRELLTLGYRRAYLYRNTAIILQGMGDYEGARAALIAYQDFDPEDPNLYFQWIYLIVAEENAKAMDERCYDEVVEMVEALKASPSYQESDEYPIIRGLVQELVDKSWIEEVSL